MNTFFLNIRFYVILLSVFISVFLYLHTIITTPQQALQIIKLTKYYALFSIFYLYITLLAGPLCRVFLYFPLRGKYLKVRRALGVSAFYFGLLHALFAFFGQLDGFSGLGSLTGKYLLAIFLSFVGLVILSLLALTSFDFIIAKLTYKKWKFLHRFVYFAGILILIHAFMIGSDFTNFLEIIPQVLFVALGFLFILEAICIKKLLKNSSSFITWRSIVLFFIALAISVVIILFLLSASKVFAHVVVKPETVGFGKIQIFTVGVPSEKDVSTVEVKLLIPKDVKHVMPNVKPGWKIEVNKTGSGSARITEIIWTGGNIPPGQRDEFLFSAQAPNKELNLPWLAYQTHQDGSIIAWDKNSPKSYTATHPETITIYSETSVINQITPTPKPQEPTPNQIYMQIGLPIRLGILAILLALFSLWLHYKKRKKII